MKSAIEIIIRKNESGALCTEVTARGCKSEDITFAGLLGVMNLVVNDMDKDMSEAAKKEAAKDQPAARCKKPANKQNFKKKQEHRKPVKKGNNFFDNIIIE